jgi:hypothetical protein
VPRQCGTLGDTTDLPRTMGRCASLAPSGVVGPCLDRRHARHLLAPIPGLLALRLRSLRLALRFFAPDMHHASCAISILPAPSHSTERGPAGEGAPLRARTSSWGFPRRPFLLLLLRLNGSERLLAVRALIVRPRLATFSAQHHPHGPSAPRALSHCDPSRSKKSARVPPETPWRPSHRWAASLRRRASPRSCGCWFMTSEPEGLSRAIR